MRKTLFIGLFLLFYCGMRTHAQESLLDRKIQVSLNRVPLEQALQRVADIAGFRLSYDAEIIDPQKQVTLRSGKTKVSEILRQVMGAGVTIHQVGSHVILTRSASAGKEKKQKETFTLKGTISDALTGKPLQNAGSYLPETRTLAMTDQAGGYLLTLKRGKSQAVGFMRRGYCDTVIFVTLRSDITADIRLRPLPPSPEKLKSRTIRKLLSGNDTAVAGLRPVTDVEDLSPVRWLVTEKQRIRAQTIEVYNRGVAQVTVFPPAGTRGNAGGSYSNIISFNLLAGYTRETRGVEIGGALNIDRQRVKGFQFAGIGNIDGGRTSGCQFGGLFNINLAPVGGFQMASLVNWVADTMKAMQVGGVCNITLGRMKGLGVAGALNLGFHHVDGWQCSFLANVGLREINGAQFGGLVNYGRDNWGFQLAGLANITRRDNRGAQIAGLFNYARTLNGFQFAFINVVNTVEEGVPVGFFSYVKNGGYYRMEISADEVFYANIAFRSGTRHFYNIYRIGIGKEEMAGFHWGFGTLIAMSPALDLGIDLSNGVVMTTATGLKYHGMLSRLAPTLDIRLVNRITLYFGPALNLYWFNTGNSIMTNGIAPYTLYDKTFTNGPHRIQCWAGGTLGLKIF